MSILEGCCRRIVSGTLFGSQVDACFDVGMVLANYDPGVWLHKVSIRDNTGVRDYRGWIGVGRQLGREEYHCQTLKHNT